jgi:hypothetical protein
MANKYMRKCSTSLVIKEMQITVILRFHLTPVIMAIIKKTTNAGEDAGERNPYTLLVWVNWCNYCENQYGSSWKTKSRAR